MVIDSFQGWLFRFVFSSVKNWIFNWSKRDLNLTIKPINTLSVLIDTGERLRNLWTIERVATDWTVWPYNSLASWVVSSSYFPFVDVGNGLSQLWLVLARHFSERAVRFRSNRLAQPTLFCSLAYGKYWDRHSLPWDFHFVYTLLPGPHFRAQ